MRKVQNARPGSRRAVMALVGHLPPEKRGKGVCGIVGHSHLVDFGNRCARCLGDTGFVPAQVLVLGSPKTMANRAKFKAMTWRDKLYAPSNPFGEM